MPDKNDFKRVNCPAHDFRLDDDFGKINCPIHGKTFSVEWIGGEWKEGPVCLRCYAETAVKNVYNSQVGFTWQRICWWLAVGWCLTTGALAFHLFGIL